MNEFWRMPLTVEMFGKSYLTKKGWLSLCIAQGLVIGLMFVWLGADA